MVVSKAISFYRNTFSTRIRDRCPHNSSPVSKWQCMLQQQQQELSFLLFRFFWHHSFLDIIFWSSCTHKNRQTEKWRIVGFLYLSPGKAKETGDFELLPKRHLRGSCISQKKLIQINFTPCLKSWLLTKEFCAYTRNLVLVFNYILPRTLKPQPRIYLKTQASSSKGAWKYQLAREKKINIPYYSSNSTTTNKP